MPNIDPVVRSLVNAVTLLLIVYLVAVPFYMHVEGMSLVDALYFTSVTITTVGYGDVVPRTEAGKLFTIGVLFSGISIFFYHLTHLGQFRERNIDPHVQRRLQILRNLTALQTGEVGKSELKKIKDKISAEKESDRNHGFGRL